MTDARADNPADCEEAREIAICSAGYRDRVDPKLAVSEKDSVAYIEYTFAY
jgi:hypothetical protein